jgi:DNA-binding XRE family transcriptional regulator
LRVSGHPDDKPGERQRANSLPAGVRRLTSGAGVGMVHPIMNRIREYREDAGLTRTELAARLGVSERTVWRWEAGEGIHDTHKLQLCDVFGIPRSRLATLLGWDEDGHE